MSLYNDYDQHLADSNPVTVQKQNNFIIGEKGKGAALMSQLCVAYGKKDANGDDLTDVEFDFLLAEHKEVIRKLAMLGTRGRATFFGDGYVVMMRFVICKRPLLFFLCIANSYDQSIHKKTTKRV